MPRGWEWDESLFAGAAPYYLRGRLPYVDELAAELAKVLGLDGTGRLLDVGCGPGVLGISLGDRYAQVVGIDPDPQMIAEARRRSAEAGMSGKTQWIQLRAEELPAGLGAFTTVGFGQSFHWMDRDKVAATVRDMLEPGGWFVHVSDVKKPQDGHDTELPHPRPPSRELSALVKRYLGPARRAGQGVLLYGTPDGEAEVLHRAGFVEPRRYTLPGGRALERSSEGVLAGLYSRSDSAPHLFGQQQSRFEAEARELLRRASPSGRFSERQPGTELMLWRKPSG